MSRASDTFLLVETLGSLKKVAKSRALEVSVDLDASFFSQYSCHQDSQIGIDLNILLIALQVLFDSSSSNSSARPPVYKISYTDALLIVTSTCTTLSGEDVVSVCKIKVLNRSSLTVVYLDV